MNKRPGNGLKEIQFIGNEWVLTMNHGKKQAYSEAKVLINNDLFQLIQFTNLMQKRLIVLFQDQVTPDQLRLLHLKIVHVTRSPA